MGFLALEHSKAAYRADFVLYGAAVTAFAAFVLMDGPRDQTPEILAYASAGLVGWTAIEYALHRFVLHRMLPFSRWHAEHHQRPRALICAPTILSAALIALLVFLPALALGDLWRACALTTGILAGYLAFSITHHATHHWRADSAWLKRRKRWHALHHDAVGQPGCYGVTCTFWDHILGSARRTRVTSRCGSSAPTRNS
jgi:sterol desaturase/sphingolipid hydroxylase (fatty acid hydroxylase superfamily)